MIQIDLSENWVLHIQENGVETIVDRDIAEWLKENDIHLINVVNKTYVGMRKNGKLTYLHRFITKCRKGYVVDHINGNAKDNRRINLRTCSIPNNIRHRTALNKNNKSGKRGVFFDKHRNLWKSVIKHKRKNFSLGHFKSFSEAVKSRESAEIRFWGKYSGKV